VAAEVAVVVVSLGSAFTFALSTSLKHASASRLAVQDTNPTRAWGRFMRATLTHPLWLGGIMLDVLGLSLQVIALHLGALALVQPLLISGLLFALILRQRRWHDASRREIGWGVLLTAALVGFLLLAGVTNPSAPHGGINHWPAVIAVAAGGLLATVCLMLGRKLSGSSSAALLGIAVGITYAATAALLKTVTNIALRGPIPVLTSWQLYAAVASGIAGLFLNQLAFRAGPLTASLPAIATVDPLLSIAIGIVIYHEHVRHGSGAGFGLVMLVLFMGVAAIQVSRAGQVPKVPNGRRLSSHLTHGRPLSTPLPIPLPTSPLAAPSAGAAAAELPIAVPGHHLSA
jgi:hypothetical protein